MGGLVGKFDSKMPLHVQVTSSIPVVLFVFPFPVYFQWTDVTHFQCERPGWYFLKKILLSYLNIELIFTFLVLFSKKYCCPI